MNTREQALALMRELGLTPDAAETAKQQAAIECGLDEAVHRQKIKGGCPACGQQLLFIGNGGRLTCTNDKCPEPAAADDVLNQMLYLKRGGPVEATIDVVTFPGLEKKYERAVDALRSIDFAITDTIGTDGEEKAVIETLTGRLREIRDLVYSFFEDVLAMQPEEAVVETTTANTGHEVAAATEESADDAARRMARRVIELENELGASDARVDALEEEAGKLIRALVEFGESPWWLRAAAAFNELHRLAIDKDGV